MGVPVITLLGKTHPSRVSASLIMAVGLDGCIARNPLDFVNLAIEGMKQIQEQGQSDISRSSLRQQMLRSELCNGPLFSRRFVDAVRGVWLERLASQGGA